MNEWILNEALNEINSGGLLLFSPPWHSVTNIFKKFKAHVWNNFSMFYLGCDENSLLILASFPVFYLINVLWITHQHPQFVKTMEKQMASPIYVRRRISPKSQNISKGSLIHWFPPQLSRKGFTFHRIQQYPCSIMRGFSLDGLSSRLCRGSEKWAKFPMRSALICISFPTETIQQIVVRLLDSLAEKVYLTTVQSEYYTVAITFYIFIINIPYLCCIMD